MFTLGGATSGYCATGSTRIDAVPSSMMTIEITHAKTGRCAKNLASMDHPPLAGADVDAASLVPDAEPAAGLAAGGAAAGLASLASVGAGAGAPGTPPAAGLTSLGCTGMPGPILLRPSMISLSPSASPDVTSQRSPI